MVIDFTIAYVLLAFLLMLAPFQSTPFVWARWIGGAMYSPITWRLTRATSSGS